MTAHVAQPHAQIQAEMQSANRCLSLITCHVLNRVGSQKGEKN